MRNSKTEQERGYDSEKAHKQCGPALLPDR